MSTVTESNVSSPRSGSPVESTSRYRIYLSDEDAATLIAWIESEEMTESISFNFWTEDGFGLDEALPEDGELAQGHLPPPPSPTEPASGASWPDEVAQASSGSEDEGVLFDEEELARLCLEQKLDEHEDGTDA